MEKQEVGAEKQMDQIDFDIARCIALLYYNISNEDKIEQN